LRLNGDSAFKEKRIQQIISEFRLTKCKDTFVGRILYSTFLGGKLVKGISGGERKRTSIAVDLITNPKLILLDGKFINEFERTHIRT
jgi:ABC-type multidrug transport system ATPase subunit